MRCVPKRALLQRCAGRNLLACTPHSRPTSAVAWPPFPLPQVEPLPNPADAAAAEADPEGAAAAQMLALVRGKATPEELDAWQAEQVGAL